MKISKKNMSIAWSLYAVGWKSKDMDRIKRAYYLTETEAQQIEAGLKKLEDQQHG